MAYPQMRPSVNYYHYSVYKLLLVNLTSSFRTAASPKNFFDSGRAIAQRHSRLRQQRLANAHASADLLPAQKKFPTPVTLPAQAKSRRRPGRQSPENALKPGKPSSSVDKPMNIHRIECAKPRDLATAVLLSSFRPRQKQALSSSFERR